MSRVIVVDIPGWVERFDDPADAIRLFEPVIQAIENTVPLVRVLQPGRVAMTARGPVRFYGGEQGATEALRAVHPESRVGLADGLFTAVTAADLADPIWVVPEGRSAEFLAPLAVERLADPDLVDLLRRLGIETLGRFAELDRIAVRDRFGVAGEYLHRSASGDDDSPIRPRDIPVDYARQIDCEPPVSRADELAFTVRQTADEFVDTLALGRLVCTSVWVSLTNERGETRERCWAHPRSFTAADLVDRVRWQLDSLARLTTDTSTEGFAGDGIVRVRFAPDHLAPIARYERGLWGAPANDRIHSVLSRVQSILGHEGVQSLTVGGGRTLAAREVFAAWGDRPVIERPETDPWPGALTALHPTTVFLEQPVVTLRGVDAIAPAEVLTDLPRTLEFEGRVRTIAEWSGPWPLWERWWEGGALRFRLQLVDDRGVAWVLLSEGDAWHVEARYD